MPESSPCVEAPLMWQSRENVMRYVKHSRKKLKNFFARDADTPVYGLASTNDGLSVVPRVRHVIVICSVFAAKTATTMCSVG